MQLHHICFKLFEAKLFWNVFYNKEKITFTKDIMFSKLLKGFPWNFVDGLDIS